MHQSLRGQNSKFRETLNVVATPARAGIGEQKIRIHHRVSQHHHNSLVKQKTNSRKTQVQALANATIEIEDRATTTWMMTLMMKTLLVGGTVVMFKKWVFGGVSITRAQFAQHCFC